MITYSIIQKSQLEGAHRLDAEYYQPEYLESMNVLSKVSPKTLLELSLITDGNHLSIAEQFVEFGVRYLRGKDLQDFYISDDDPIYIPDKIYQKLKRSYIYEKDVLVSIVGTVGLISIVADNFDRLTGSCKIAILHTKKIDPWFLAVFLISRYGQNQIQRKVAGAVQTGIILKDLSNVLVPLLSLERQKEIREISEEAYKQQLQSKSLYLQAENLLLEELGLSSFAKAMEDEKDLSWIVNLSDIKSANRVDAEYFQPKYQKLISKIELKGVKKLEDFIKDYSTGFPFKSENYQEDGIPLIRINNIKKGVIDLSDTAYLSDRDYSLSPKDTAKPGDIVLSMSGTIGMSAVIPADVPKCSVNQRILRFSSKNTDSDYLALVVNSIVGRYQLGRIGTGGVQTNISYRDIRNILIPALPKQIQQKIAELVRKSHEARKRSKELLEEAKRKVEEMIEKGGDVNV